MQQITQKRRNPESVNIIERGIITLCGEAMRNRKGTLAYFANTIKQAGVSCKIVNQPDEDAASPPSITFAVDTNKLDYVTKELAKAAFGEPQK